MKYIDLHCDTLGKGIKKKQKTITRLEDTMLDINRALQSGVQVQFFAIFVPQRQYHANFSEWFQVNNTCDEDQLFADMYALFERTLEENRQHIAFAGSFADMQKNENDNKLSAFLTLENGYIVKGIMDNIQILYKKGIRLMTLTWNDPNCFGFPHSEKYSDMEKGLTDFGKEAVEYMNQLGMIIDVSHLSDAGFYDVAKISDKPFVASHSNCRSICGATRNLTDEMIRTLADKGGVAGLNLCPAFVCHSEKGNESTVQALCDHIDHFIKIGGIECLAIGTDFDGIGGNLEIDDCTKMHHLFNELQHRGYTSGQIEKIALKNAKRVIKDIIG